MASSQGAGYAELREAATTAEAAAAAAEAAAAAARATADEATRAMQAHSAHGLADSPLALLDGHSSLRLATDAVHADDALCLALTCRALRDALWARFPQVPCDRRKSDNRGKYMECKGTYAATTTRLRTRDAAVVATVARFVWALAQPQRPSWLCYPGGGEAAPVGCAPWANAAAGLRQRASAAADEATARYSVASVRARQPTPRKELAATANRRRVAIAHIEAIEANETQIKRLGLYERAAAAGALDTLRWLAQCASSLNCWRQDCDEVRSDEMCAAAAGGGHLAVLRWLRESGCNWDEETCAAAARGGHLVGVRHPHPSRCFGAAGVGHLDVLRWARANGCEWDEETCRAAACRGHLATLQWARANGCPWDKAECLLQMRYGADDDETREWIERQPA
jgi:hypothetical protein